MFHKGENTRPVILLFVTSCWNCISDLESCKVTLHTRPPPSIQAYSLLVIKNKITCRKSVENDALLFWPLSPLSLPHPSPSFYPIFSCCESRLWQLVLRSDEMPMGGGGVIDSKRSIPVFPTGRFSAAQLKILSKFGQIFLERALKLRHKICVLQCILYVQYIRMYISN